MGVESKVNKVLVGKPDEESLLVRPRSRLEDGVKMDVREMGWQGVEWTHLAEGRDRWRALKNTAMSARIQTPRS
jgi:hypothetical protein